jgi:hypothetical protein
MKKFLWLLLPIVMSSGALAGSECQFLAEFPKHARNTRGVQIGVVIDPFGQGAAYAAVADFDNNTPPIALKALESAKKVNGSGGISVTKVQYGELGAMITAIENISGANGRSWLYFHWSGEKWNLSKVGVSSKVKGAEAEPLRDGAIIGFALSKWITEGVASNTPRCPETKQE